jgi:hypothetical protein
LAIAAQCSGVRSCAPGVVIIRRVGGGGVGGGEVVSTGGGRGGAKAAEEQLREVWQDARAGVGVRRRAFGDDGGDRGSNEKAAGARRWTHL